MEAAGIPALIVIDTTIPLGLCVLLVLLNARNRRSATSEVRFWGIALLYVGLIAAVSAFAGATVEGSHGYSLLGATAIAFPMSLPGAIVHQIAAINLGVENDSRTTAVFALCLTAWSLLNALLARRIYQAIRRTSPPTHL